MASFDPTILLTAYILGEFPDVAGYNSATRADLLLLSGVPNPTYVPTFYEYGLTKAAPTEVVGYITDRINATQYGNLPADKKLKVFKLGEYAYTLAWQNGGASNPGFRIQKGLISQGGTSAPGIVLQQDSLSSLTPVTTIAWTRTGVGTYDVTCNLPLFLMNKVSLTIDIGRADNAVQYSVARFSDTVLNVGTYISESDILTGIITGTLTDGLLSNSVFELLVYP